MSRKLALILALATNLAWAQSSPTTPSPSPIAPLTLQSAPPRTLEDTLRLAESHPETLQAYGRYLAASGNLRAARGARWFTLDGDAALGVQHYVEPGNKGAAGVGEAGLSLFQPLLDGGLRAARQEGASHRKLGAEEELEWQKRQRRYAAAEGHIQLWLAQELAKTATANHHALAIIASTTILRFKQGEATKTEHAEVESRAATARALQAERTASLGTAQAGYLRVVGLTAVQGPAPRVAMPTLPGPQEYAPSPTHPLIAAARAERDDAAAALKAAQAGNAATLDVRGRTEHNRFDGTSRDDTTTLSRLTLNLGYRFLDHGVTAGEIAAARGDLYAAEAYLQNAELEVHSAHKAATARQATAQTRAIESKQALEQAAKAADTLMQEVKNGNRPLRDLLDARRDQLNAYDGWLRAYADQILAAYDLQRWE